jgi:hypothetical protein
MTTLGFVLVLALGVAAAALTVWMGAEGRWPGRGGFR